MEKCNHYLDTFFEKSYTLPTKLEDIWIFQGSLFLFFLKKCNAE